MFKRSSDKFIQPRQVVGQLLQLQQQSHRKSLWDFHVEWRILDHRIFLPMVVPCVFTGQAEHSGGEKADRCGRELIMHGKNYQPQVISQL